MTLPPSYFQQHAQRLIAQCDELIGRNGAPIADLRQIKTGLNQAVAEIEARKARAMNGSDGPVVTVELIGMIDNLQDQLHESRHRNAIA